MMEIIEKKASIEASRFAKVPRLLRDVAWYLDVKLEMDIDKGWFSETIWYKVIGEESKVKQFNELVIKSIEEYNSTR
jgi:hypothetical protein